MLHCIVFVFLRLLSNSCHLLGRKRNTVGRFVCSQTTLKDRTIYNKLFRNLALSKTLVLNSKKPFETLHHCHFTTQSNTVSSFCVQVNMCKRQWVSNVIEGPLKVGLKSTGQWHSSWTWSKKGNYTILLTGSHDRNIRQERIDLLPVNLGCLS